jgi:hypothetical protein
MESQDAHTIMVVENRKSRHGLAYRTVESIRQTPDTAPALSSLAEFPRGIFKNAKRRIGNNRVK